ncbi:MAG: class I SAM-dependent methyltransferase [Anaerolineae bacterium]|nr:class I SAM-dependent methyltransferase [Anaerolineae bacterium]
MASNAFPPAYFRREDERDDPLFYSFPRLVVHIDDHAIAALTEVYRRVLPAGGVVLDLMSSYRSHLPEDAALAAVMGLGMNAVEMAQNPQLDDYVIHDLNAAPMLPFEDGVFDAVICAVSVQYLTRPLDVFREVRRILKPGGVFVVSFSNRCFPTKAVAAWRAMTDVERLALVSQYFDLSGGWYEADSAATESSGHDPLYAIWARKSAAY